MKQFVVKFSDWKKPSQADIDHALKMLKEGDEFRVAMASAFLKANNLLH